MANDPLRSNKVFGAVLLAGVIATGSAFVANLLYPSGQAKVTGYVIEVPDAPAAGGEVKAVDTVMWPEVEGLISVAAANNSVPVLEAGGKLFKKCSSCHNIADGAPHKVGPNLWSVVDSKIANADGYSYSNALKDISDRVWSDKELNAFLTNPREYAPGTKMSYRGMKKPQDRAALLYYLGQQH